MNKSDLINEVANNAGLTKVDAGKAIDAVFNAIADSLAQKKSVRLAGFGTFDTKDRPASEGRNPRTGEKIQIAATTQAKFRPAKELKEKVAG